MHSSLASPSQVLLCIRVAFLAALTVLLSSWTCSAFFFWGSCENEAAPAEITSLLPDTMSSEAGSVLLTVEGSGFTPQAKILWNGSILETTFNDEHHLQATITRETFESFGGSAGSNVLISVRPQGSVSGSGCPKQQDSAPQSLVIQSAWKFSRLEYLGTVGAVRLRVLQGRGIAVLPEHYVDMDAWF